ncbi:MAG: PEP-CTERM sorting domain-containing protein [Colwellia sp.]|nr:PEP-CTERM sorting domain-containing protein [Colwellia sp.]
MLNKLVLRALLSLSLAFSFAGAANATLINQDIIDGDGANIGSISINIDDLDDFGGAFKWEEFNILGFDMLAPDAIDNEFGEQFIAEFDLNDIYAGIFNIAFDLVDVFGLYQWGGATFIDVDGTVDSYGITVNQLGAQNPPLVAYISSFSFGEVTVVPTPATLVLFLTAVAGLVVRRKTL